MIFPQPSGPQRARQAFVAALMATLVTGTALPALAISRDIPPAMPMIDSLSGIRNVDNAPRIHVAQSRESAELSLRIQQLEEQIRNLTGQVDGLQFQLTQMQTLIERQTEDNEFRFEALEGGAGGKTEAATQSGGVMPSAELPQDPMDQQSRDQQSLEQQSVEQSAQPAEIEANPIPADPDAIPDEGVFAGPDDILFDPLYEGDNPPQDDLGTSLDPLLGTGLGTEGVPLGTLSPAELEQLQGSRGIGADAGGTVQLSSEDADAQYLAGYDAITRGDYAFAEEQFRQFRDLYPTNPRIADAINWLGEAMIQRGAYDEAAEVLLDGYQSHPDSARAPDMLLKLGIALNGADERETACRMFSEVTKRYTTLSPAFQNRLNAEMGKAQCPPA